MPRGKLVNSEERNTMLRLELAGYSRAKIALHCKRSKATVTKVLGAKRPKKNDATPRDQAS